MRIDEGDCLAGKLGRLAFGNDALRGSLIACCGAAITPFVKVKTLGKPQENHREANGKPKEN